MLKLFLLAQESKNTNTEAKILHFTSGNTLIFQDHFWHFQRIKSLKICDSYKKAEYDNVAVFIPPSPTPVFETNFLKRKVHKFKMKKIIPSCVSEARLFIPPGLLG